MKRTLIHHAIIVNEGKKFAGSVVIEGEQIAEVIAGDARPAQACDEEIDAKRRHYKEIFEGDETLQEQYTDYTEMPDFEAEIDKLTAKYQDQFDELTAWETAIDAQITTASAELEEVNAYMESIKSMLSSNIQEDFNYGLNG